MRKPTLARLLPQLIRQSKARSGAAKRRPVRLHAERLEERMLMSVNDPAPTIAQAAPMAAATSVATSDASDVTRAGTASKALAARQTTQSPSDRFASTEELRAWLIEAATTEWGDLFGQPTYSPYYVHHWFLGDSVVLRAQGDIQAMDATTAVQFNATSTTTNVQVAGVDEADFVETDGEYLYIVSGQDLVIVSAREGEALSVVSRVHLDRRPAGMYLSANRLAIVSRSDADYGIWPLRTRLIDIGTIAAFDDVAPLSYAKPTTTVTVLDITDRAQPALVQKTELEGRLVSSRAVDGQLRLVVSNDLQLPPPIAKQVNDGAQAEAELDRWEPVIPVGDVMTMDLWWPRYVDSNYVYETKDEYVARVVDDVLSSFDARIRSFDASGAVISESSLLEAASIYRPDSFGVGQTTTVATFDMHGDDAGPVDKASIMTGGAAQVYATADSIYVFAQEAPETNAMGLILLVGPEKSNVWRFGIDNETHSIELMAEGEFDGTLLNQFAADEKDGYLRIVSQSDRWSGLGQSVVVLQEADGRLNVVGGITGIATDESLYSVRIVDDRVFFVTFRQIDPLFVVDLSDPTKPEMMGELHIPGFSDYLQPIDATHLLAIGRHAETTGGVAELQVSIFDVSDLHNPRLAQRYSLGGGSTTVTPATGDSFTRGDGDHHAVSYFADEQILAIPIHSLGYSNNWGLETPEIPLFEPGQGGLQVFRVDVDAGFTPIGLIEHDTLIARSLRIGERLFAISSGTVSAHSLLDPGATLGSVDIGSNAERELVELKMYVAAVDEPIEQVLSMQTAAQEAAPNSVDNEPPSADAELAVATAALPQAGWVLPSLKSSRHTQPAGMAAFSAQFTPRRVDNELASLLAAESATEQIPFDSLIQIDDPGTNPDALDDTDDRSNDNPFARATVFGHWFRSMRG
jgi:uncharacterized secreted protein with C-terminal beta-propeller domain